MSTYKSDAQILDHYNVALTNVESQPEIAATMTEFGYGPEVIAEGRQLLSETRNAYDFNQQEDNETVAARADFDAKAEQMANTYGLHRKKAKVIFRKDEVALKQLGLTGTLPRAYVKWVETMKTFYNGVQADAALLAKLTPLKITAEDITAALSGIEAMESARTLYFREIGESQEATKAKDAAFVKIDDWMYDFYAVAKIAMEDKPQLLEALGVLVRS